MLGKIEITVKVGVSTRTESGMRYAVKIESFISKESVCTHAEMRYAAKIETGVIFNACRMRKHINI